ncbi:hypothetical protein ZHAS_00007319 [Anopheles sinensis]|uniref:Uncharacterized protein n=1 Tax=Anopheles sinensis TaxID=74873 RepID=A0A084VPP3_ANOSI|nr:hypothetical protein ZHAS_00007319 [Anopheles sinensis]
MFRGLGFSSVGHSTLSVPAVGCVDAGYAIPRALFKYRLCQQPARTSTNTNTPRWWCSDGGPRSARPAGNGRSMGVCVCVAVQIPSESRELIMLIIVPFGGVRKLIQRVAGEGERTSAGMVFTLPAWQTAALGLGRAER